MTVSIEYAEDTTNVNEFLQYAQTIADAFSKALDQNECNVKVLIGLAEQIASDKEKVKDIFDFSENPNSSVTEGVLDKGSEGRTVEDYPGTSLEATPNEVDADQLIRTLRDQCLDCDLNFPTLDFNGSLDWAFDRLRAALDVFNNIFKKLLNPNFCHVANAMTYACIPSIIALIMLLVAAYAAVLALQKLGGISLSAFIQGIIKGLLGLIVSSLSLRFDTSNTGVNCIIQSLREISNNIIAEQESISGAVPTEILEQLGYKPPESRSAGYVSIDENAEKDLLTELDSLKEPKTTSEWTRDAFLETYASMSLRDKSLVDNYLDRVEDEMATVNNSISSAFNEVTEVVEDMTGSLNEELQKMFGLLDYFQCESERSGLNFTTNLEYIDRIMTVINLLSAILAVVAKKAIKKLCKTKDSVKDLTTILEEDKSYVGDSLTELEKAEVIEEFLGKVVEVTENENGDILPIIYDKDKEPLLPKLSFTTCNLKDFIEGHAIEKVVEDTLKKIVEEEKREEERKEWEKDNGTDGRVRLPFEHVIDKSKWEVYPIKFEKPSYEIKTSDDITTNVISKIVNSNQGVSSGIQSILDLVYNNPLDNNVNITDKSNTYTPTDNEDDSIVNKEYRDFIKAPLAVDNKQKKAFQDKCRDITDVLDKLGSLTQR